MALVEYHGNPSSPTMTANAHAKNQQQSLMAVDTTSISAEDVGQLIHHLQEEIKIIKLQLENLPGYASGKCTCTFIMFR